MTKLLFVLVCACAAYGASVSQDAKKEKKDHSSNDEVIHMIENINKKIENIDTNNEYTNKTIEALSARLDTIEKMNSTIQLSQVIKNEKDLQALHAGLKYGVVFIDKGIPKNYDDRDSTRVSTLHGCWAWCREHRSERYWDSISFQTGYCVCYENSNGIEHYTDVDYYRFL